jgi:autotransporter-associated beta strand protein
VQVNSGITVDAAKPPSLVVSNGAALGAGGAGNGTVINSGATVALVGGITVPNEEASIAGAGFPSTGAFGVGSRGALQSVSGSNVWNGNITLLADARIGAQDNASLTVNGVIGGVGSIVIRPSSNSVVRLNAQNIWSSNTLVFATASGVVPYGVVLLGTNNALPTTTQLRLDLNGYNQSVAGIAPGGGSGPSSFIENGAASTTSTFTLANTTNNTWNGNIVDGAGVVAVVKTGPGQQILTGTNTYTGATTVNAGELRITGRLGNTAAGVSGTGTLSGTGSLDGAVTVSSGGTLSPGAGGVGTLTISNNLSLAGNVLVELNKSLAPSNDVVNVTGTLAYGGAMTVTNLGTALTLGDQFPIFPAGGTGTLAVSGNAGAGLAFDFNEITGVLSVVSSAPSPTALNFANVSSGVYQFSWTGPFTLQWQTNSAAVGLITNWVAYPDVSNPVNVTNDPTIPATFFRLISTP